MTTEELTLGSLFDGSGGFPLGGILAGIKPVWSAEIEPFPVLVTHKRLPGVKHYGDVSNISGAELEPVDIITFGSPCFPEGTLVLTETGYVPIENVVIGMRVLTHMGRWRTVTAAGAKYGETVVLKGNHYGLECTPNHPIYCSGERKYYPRQGNGKRGNQILLTDEKSWIPAEKMQGRLWAVPRTVESLPIASPVYSGSWRQKPLPELSGDLLYFIGRWIGDGWVCNGQRAGRPSGETYGKIYLCDSEDKEDELRSIIEKMTEKYTVSHDRGVVRFSFISQLLAEWLTDNFGQHAYGKSMPGWVFGLSESYRQALLNGILDSDGYRVKGKDGTWKVTTVSKPLAESIRLLAEIQGYSTTVHKTEVEQEKLIDGRLVHQRDWYSVVITLNGKRTHLVDDLHGWYRVRDVQPTNRTKMVYNLTVEEDNSYVADGIVVHNCQDMSIAGRRAGLDGERSGLFYQAIRIIKEMREATDGKYPRYCVWENVPGAFSSNHGEDFRAVLEAVISVKETGIEVPAPENNRWAKSDVLLGDGWSVAYRVLDAQYWGVPQRRARIYLVGDFTGGSAGEVLFKSEGMSGYTPQGFRSWQGTAGGAEEGPGETGGRSDAGGGNGRYCLNPQGCSGITVTEESSGTLIAQDHGNHPAVLQSAGFSTEHSAQSRSIGYEEEKSPTLRAGVVPAAMAIENHPTDGRVKIREDGQCQTLTERMGTGGGNVPLVAEPEPMTLKIRCGKAGGGKGALVQKDKSATLGTNNDQTLFQPVEPQGFDRYNGKVTGDVSHTLDTGVGNTIPMVFQESPKAYGIAKEGFNSGEKAAFNFSVKEELSPTLQATGPHAVAKPEIKAFGVSSKTSHGMLSDNPRSGFYEAKTSRTLDQGGGNPTCNQGGICVVSPVSEKPVLAMEPGAASRVGGHVYQDGKSGALRANPGDNQQAVAYALQGSMIGREEKNGPQGDGINEDVSFTLNTVDHHAVAVPSGEHYSTSKNSYHTTAVKEQASTLVASDYKDPPCVNDTPNDEPMYIVRRLTPVECARLQGFPDWWCDGLAITDPSDEEIAFWAEVWETWRGITNPDGKPKTEKQIRKWLASPYTDAAEYKLWGNGISLPIVYFVLSGIAWAAEKSGEAE